LNIPVMGKTPSQENSLNSPKRFLLLPICGLGDAICYLPFVRTLRRRFPEAEIVAIVSTDGAGTIIEGSLSEIEVIVFNRGQRRGWLVLPRLLWALRRRRFEVVISGAHPNSLRVPLLAALCGAKLRIGASSERLSFLYNRTVNVRTDAHVLERNRKLLMGVGTQMSPEEYRPTLEPPREARDSALRLWTEAGLDGAKCVIGMASGADSNVRGRYKPSLKRWNIGGYAKVAAWVTKEAGARVAMFGVADEAPLAAAIAATSGVPIVNLCGKTEVRQLQWLLRKCRVLVSNDTGAMHMAVALGTPVVALFGPTSPDSFGPRGDRDRVVQGKVPCSPCYPRPTCDLRGCLAMDIISGQQVIECLSGLLNVPAGAAVSPD
jgi:lipopolysaccharide heptosyltransferase II